MATPLPALCKDAFTLDGGFAFIADARDAAVVRLRGMRGSPDELQLARKRARSTFLSYSASVASVISAPLAAKTRPPLRRHAWRSY